MRKKLKSYIPFSLFLVFSLLLFLLNPFFSLNFILQDRLTQIPGKPQADIFVIGIDSKSLNALGPWNKWPRSTMAKMISLLNGSDKSRPKVIGIDVMYFGRTQDDRDLFEAAASCDNLVFAAELEFASGIQKASDGAYRLEPSQIGEITRPQSPLDRTADFGFTNVFMDGDGRVRRSLISADVSGKTYDNFAYAIYKKYAASSGVSPAAPRVENNGLWTIPYCASPGAYGKGLSFVDVLEGRVPAALFKDSIVLIGSYATGMMDSYYTPASQGTPMFGVEINANMVEALCRGKNLQTVPVLLQLLLMAACLTLCRCLYRRETLVKNITLLVCVLGWFLLTALLSGAGWLLVPLYLPLASAVLYLYSIVMEYLRERGKRLQTLETFKRYVSPEVANHLLDNLNAPLTDLGGSRKRIAVMFVDIRGFTPLSESLSPEEVAGILNEYLTLTSSVIFQNGGTVDKFIGDATMALFNAPSDLDDYVYQAVKTALEIMEGSGELRARLLERYHKSIHLGIGIHCGDAVVGSIGASFRMDYTAIGDTVNTASRLEGAAAPDQILITRGVLDELSGRILVTPAGSKQLKGKSLPVELYQVDGLA